MRAHSKAITLASCLLYALALLAPRLHDLSAFSAPDESCAQCASLLASGPAFEAACGGAGPCADPDHHHHHGAGHNHRQCLVCKHSQTNAALIASAPARFVLAVLAGAPLCSSADLSPFHLRDPHRPRAPPVLS